MQLGQSATFCKYIQGGIQHEEHQKHSQPHFQDHFHLSYHRFESVVWQLLVDFRPNYGWNLCSFSDSPWHFGIITQDLSKSINCLLLMSPWMLIHPSWSQAQVKTEWELSDLLLNEITAFFLATIGSGVPALSK